MEAALRRLPLPGATWRSPRAGLFHWLQLDPGIDTRRLLEQALEREHVAFVPGEAFTASAQAGRDSRMRLNFSHPTLDAIEDGILRIARAAASYEP